MKNEEWRRKQYREQRSHNEKVRKSHENHHAEQQRSWDAHRAAQRQAMEEEAVRREAHRRSQMQAMQDEAERREAHRVEKLNRDSAHQEQMRLLRLSENENRRQHNHLRDLVEYIVVENNIPTLMNYILNWTDREAAAQVAYGERTNQEPEFISLNKTILKLHYDILNKASREWGGAEYNHANDKFIQFKNEVTDKQDGVNRFNRLIGVPFAKSDKLLAIERSLEESNSIIASLSLKAGELKMKMSGFHGLFFKQTKKQAMDLLTNTIQANELIKTEHAKQVTQLLKIETKSYQDQKATFVIKKSELLNQGNESISKWTIFVKNYHQKFEIDMIKNSDDEIAKHIESSAVSVFEYIEKLQLNVKQSSKLTLGDVGCWYAANWREFKPNKPCPKSLPSLSMSGF